MLSFEACGQMIDTVRTSHGELKFIIDLEAAAEYASLKQQVAEFRERTRQLMEEVDSLVLFFHSRLSTKDKRINSLESIVISKDEIFALQVEREASYQRQIEASEKLQNNLKKELVKERRHNRWMIVGGVAVIVGASFFAALIK